MGLQPRKVFEVSKNPKFSADFRNVGLGWISLKFTEILSKMWKAVKNYFFTFTEKWGNIEFHYYFTKYYIVVEMWEIQ